jgi:uncharacterized membrane-anchored protein YhcB (DUF1043 family)
MDITPIHFVTTAVGLAIGIGVGFLIARRASSGKNAAQLAQEHQQYRQDVAQHFARTAELVNGMTDSYKAVFDHLQGGARELMDEDTLRRTLADQSDEVITLNRLGWQTGPSDNGQQANERPESNEPTAATPEAEPEVDESGKPADLDPSAAEGEAAASLSDEKSKP